MEKILSVIIPTYNMENYLHVCLNSLLIPSLDALDIIVVNDGSTDRSSEIAHSFESKYPKSFRVIDKDNGNYGSCINTGLKYVCGKYVKILDSDDSFDTENLELYIYDLIHLEADLIVTDYQRFDENGKLKALCKFDRLESSRVYNFQENQNMLTDPNLEMHAITYKRSIFDNLNYIQTEGISYTDQEWMFKPMIAVATYAYVNKCIYRYLVGREGQTIDMKVRLRSIKQIIMVAKSILSVYASNVIKQDDIYFINRLNRIVPYIYKTILFRLEDKANYKILEDFDQFVAKYNPLYYQSLNKERTPYVAFHYIKYWRKKNKTNAAMIRLDFFRIMTMIKL